MNAQVLTNTSTINHIEWVESRRKGIGGSDIAGIVGVSKYKSPITVFQDKMGELPDTAGEAAYWGTVLEDVVAKEFQQRTGLRIRRRKAILQHPDYEWAIANVDRLIVGRKEGLECKTANEFLKKEWTEDHVPNDYFLQCQWYMAVTGYHRWHIAVLLGGNTFYMNVIERDEELIQTLLNRAESFWNDHVLTGNPPEFDGSDGATELLKYLYPEGDSEASVTLGNSYLEKLERRDEITDQINQLTKEKTEIDNKIKGEMGEAELAIIGDGSRKVTWKTHSYQQFNKKGFEKDYPDLYQKYIENKTQRKIGVK